MTQVDLIRAAVRAELEPLQDLAQQLADEIRSLRDNGNDKSNAG